MVHNINMYNNELHKKIKKNKGRGLFKRTKLKVGSIKFGLTGLKPKQKGVNPNPK